MWVSIFSGVLVMLVLSSFIVVCNLCMMSESYILDIW